MDFGIVPFGCSRTLPLTLTNTGGGTLVGMLELEFAGGDFTIEDDPNYTIPPGENRVFDIKFTPTIAGLDQDYIRTGCAAPDQIALLGGRNEFLAEDYGLSPTVTDFGEVEVGTQVEQSLTLHNGSSYTASFTVSSSCGYVTITNGSSFTLDPQEGRTITVQFTSAVEELPVSEIEVGCGGNEVPGRALVMGEGVLPVGIDDPTPPPNIASGLISASPNPFRDNTRIRYAVSDGGPIEVAVYDVAGRLVATLARTTVEPGEHDLTWDGLSSRRSRVATGIYYVRLSTPEGRFVQSIVLIR